MRGFESKFNGMAKDPESCIFYRLIRILLMILWLITLFSFLLKFTCIVHQFKKIGFNILLVHTGQWFKILLPEEWSCYARDGSYQLDTLRSDKKGIYTSNYSWNCQILCCWKVWLPTSWSKYPGLYIFYSCILFI